MSHDSDRLRFRREVLLLHGALQRQDLRDHLQRIEATLDGVDRGLSLVRRVATPPVLLAGGVVATLLLGRRRTRQVLAGGLALFGQFALGQLDLGQLVRRSR